MKKLLLAAAFAALTSACVPVGPSSYGYRYRSYGYGYGRYRRSYGYGRGAGGSIPVGAGIYRPGVSGGAGIYRRPGGGD